MEAIRQLADGSMGPAVAKTGDAQHSSYLTGVLAFGNDKGRHPR